MLHWLAIFTSTKTAYFPSPKYIDKWCFYRMQQWMWHCMLQLWHQKTATSLCSMLQRRPLRGTGLITKSEPQCCTLNYIMLLHFYFLFHFNFLDKCKFISFKLVYWSNEKKMLTYILNLMVIQLSYFASIPEL